MDGPLLLTEDDALRAEVTRVLGPVQTRRPSPAARAAWSAVPVVLLGLDALEPLRAAGMPRREHVLLVTPGEPSAWEWKAAVDLGVSSVLALPGDARLLVDRVAGRGQPGAGTARLVGLVAGCGGAGASTVAAALAAYTARNGPTVLIDADPYAGGIDILLGAEDLPGVRWADLDQADRRPDDLIGSLPGSDRLRVLSYGFGELHLPSLATSASVLDVVRRGCSSVVVDLPKVLDPAAEVWLAALDLVVVVVAATVRGVAAAATAARVVTDRGSPVAVAIRDPGGARLTVDDIANGLRLPVVGTIRSDPAVLRAADHGRPPLPESVRARRQRAGSLEQLCADVVARLADPPS